MSKLLIGILAAIGAVVVLTAIYDELQWRGVI